MKLVRRRDEQDRVVLGRQAREVCLLALTPGWLGVRVRVGAAFNDPPDFGTEAPDGRPGRICRLTILDGVVEQGGNRLVFTRAVFESDGARAEQVAQVRDLCSLAF